MRLALLSPTVKATRWVCLSTEPWMSCVLLVSGVGVVAANDALLVDGELDGHVGTSPGRALLSANTPSGSHSPSGGAAACAPVAARLAACW